jgi:hypothetical protein
VQGQISVWQKGDHAACVADRPRAVSPVIPAAPPQPVRRPHLFAAVVHAFGDAAERDHLGLVFHTLLDLADVRYPDEHPEWSFVNVRFKQRKRYVDSCGWTDYDNAIMKGDCRAVIARGKPLPRE